jgi:hypothetical protein
MSEGPDVANGLREAFQGKRGKILLIGGAAVAAWWWWSSQKVAPAAVVPDDTTTTTPVTDTDTARTPQTAPLYGNTTTGTTTPARPTTNDEWVSKGVDLLVGRGTPGSSAYNALAKAMDGDPLTQTEAAWVSQVIGVLGVPPFGMPSMNIAAPTPSGQAPKPTTALKAPTGLKASTVYKTGFNLAWSDVAGARGYEVALSGKVVERPYTSGVTVQGLKPGVRYSVTVRAVASNGARGPVASISVTTKK